MQSRDYATRKVIGYARVSLEKQARYGVSLDAQREKIAAWANLNGAQVAGLFVDRGLSGVKGIDKREGLDSAIKTAIHEKGILVVYSLSRLSRSTKMTLELAEVLEKGNADLVSLSEQIDTTSSAGRMVFRLLAVLCEFERDQIAERTSNSLQYKKSQGKVYCLNAPYGWKKDGEDLIPDEHERKVMRLASSLRSDGTTIMKIVENLNERGYRNRAGNLFQYTTLRHILKASREVA